MQSDSNDKYAEFKINENKELNGNYDYEVNEPDKEVIIKTGFSPSIMERWRALGFNSELIPKLWSNVPDADNAEAKWTTKFNLRMMYYVGKTNMDGSNEWIFKTAYGTDMTQKQETRTDFPEMVSYNDDVNFYFNGINGLFKNYWEAVIIKLNNNMILEARFNLNVNDMQGIIDNVDDRDARTRIYLNQEGLRGNYEIIDLTDYDFKDIIKVKLLKK